MFPALNPAELMRLLKRAGIKVEELKATRVIVELEDGARVVIEEPDMAMLLHTPAGSSILQVTGTARREEASEGGEEAAETQPFTEEDVRLVAEQAGVSLEEARRALEETGGDIAEAIIRLQERSGGGE